MMLPNFCLCLLCRCNFSSDVRKADQREGETAAMNQISLHFLKIQEDLARLHKTQIREMLTSKCLRPLESILSMSALVSEREKAIKSATLDCDHLKSKRDSELLSGKPSDHPTVVKLSEQLKDKEQLVNTETIAVINFLDRTDAHMATMIGPETATLVGTLQYSHFSSSDLLAQLNKSIPQSAASLCELSARYESERSLLKSPLVAHEAEAVAFPDVSSHVQFLNVDIFSPLQSCSQGNNLDKEQAAAAVVRSSLTRPLSNNTQDSATCVSPPLKSGILKKKSNLLFWEERWFELHKPGILIWFKNAPDSLMTAKRKSVRCTTEGGSNIKEEARNQLVLYEEVASIAYTPLSCTILIEGLGQRKNYELFAEREELASEWYAALVPWVKRATDSDTQGHTTTFSLEMPDEPVNCTTMASGPSSQTQAQAQAETDTPAPPPRPPRPVSLSMKPPNMPTAPSPPPGS